MNTRKKVYFKNYLSLCYGNIKNKAKQLSNQRANQHQYQIELEQSVITIIPKIPTPYGYGSRTFSHWYECLFSCV